MSCGKIQSYIRSVDGKIYEPSTATDFKTFEIMYQPLKCTDATLYNSLTLYSYGIIFKLYV